jgi:hypothetical protein
MDSSTHKWIHNTFGMQYINGLSIGNYILLGDGSSNSHAQISISDGTLYQEDIVINIADGDNGIEFTQQLYPTGYFPVYYHSGVTGQWVRDSSTPYPVKYNATRALYNLYSGGTWSVINVPNNRYFAMWLVATNDINDPILSIMGQREDSSLGSAENHNNWTDINLTNIPTNELRPLYRLIFLTNNTFTNTPKSSLQSILDLRRSVLTTTYGVPQNDHGNLFGLGDDDHTQYVHINEARTISADHTFTNGLTINNGLLSATSGNFTSLSVNNTGVSLSGHIHLNTDITNWNEAVDDRVNNLLVGTSGINVSYDDNANTLTIAYTGVSGGGGGTVISNYGDNRLLTSDGTTTGINAESNLSFDGSVLALNSSSTSATYGGSLRIGPMSSGSLNASGGLEFVNASSNNGWGWRIANLDAGAGSVPLVFQQRSNLSTWSEILRITEAGNVGIGSTSPTTFLHILGTGEGIHSGRVGGGRPHIRLQHANGTVGSRTISANGNYVGQISFEGYNGTSYMEHTAIFGLINGTVTTTSIPTDLVFCAGSSGNSASNEKMRITSLGRVGIGTNNPSNILDVRGGEIYKTTTDFVFGTTGSLLAIYNGASTGNTYSAIGALSAGGSAWNNLVLQVGGNVGIGTTNPSYKLDVFNGNIRSGYANNSALLVTASSTASTGASIAIQELTGEGWTAIFADYEPYAEWGIYHDNSNDRFDFTSGDSTNNLRSYSVINRSGSTRTAYAKVSILQGSGDLLVGGSVGIGTSSPASKLHIAGTSSTFDGLLISTTASGGGAYSQIRFGTYYPSWTVAAPASIRCIDDGNFSSHITFRTKTAGSASSADVERLRITSGGNLEIRTNAGNLSSAFVYNENGGELVHYDETQTAATLLDQSANQTRLIELINGSNLVLGLGSSNTTGSIVFARAGYAEAMRIDSAGSAWIKSTRAWNDSVPALSIGNDGDGRLQVRHIWGKASGSTSSEHLWLQFGNGANHVQIGNVGQGSNLYVGGDIAVGSYFTTGTAGITASNGYVYAKRYTNIDAVSTDTSFGLFFNGATDTGYAIYREAGAWTSPFPDLRIGFHTGIKIGANATYNGIRFYTDHDMSTQVMSINNSADPLGATNVYVNNSLQAGSSLRAPIFYDSQDTNFYCDPNGTSRFAALVITGSDLYVGDGVTSSIIRMRDSDEGERQIHCNSNRIGFLNQSGGWGSWCYDDGSWANDVAMYAPIFYDSQDLSRYLDPNGFSQLGRVSCYGGTIEALEAVGGWGQYGCTMELRTDGGGTQDGPRLWHHKGSVKWWAAGIQGGTSHGYAIWEDGGNTQWGTERFRIDPGGRVNMPIGWDTSGRCYSREWIEFTNHSGLYSPLNGAHFYPNNASYGSWRIAGTRNGWAGLEFDSSPYNASLMINSNNTGIHINGVGWQWYWAGGAFYISKQSYGGGTIATVLDTSNYTTYVTPKQGSLNAYVSFNGSTNNPISLFGSYNVTSVIRATGVHAGTGKFQINLAAGAVSNTTYSVFSSANVGSTFYAQSSISTSSYVIGTQTVAGAGTWATDVSTCIAGGN